MGSTIFKDFISTKEESEKSYKNDEYSEISSQSESNDEFSENKLHLEANVDEISDSPEDEKIRELNREHLELRQKIFEYGYNLKAFSRARIQDHKKTLEDQYKLIRNLKAELLKNKKYKTEDDLIEIYEEMKSSSEKKLLENDNKDSDDSKNQMQSYMKDLEEKKTTFELKLDQIEEKLMSYIKKKIISEEEIKSYKINNKNIKDKLEYLSNIIKQRDANIRSSDVVKTELIKSNDEFLINKKAYKEYKVTQKEFIKRKFVQLKNDIYEIDKEFKIRLLKEQKNGNNNQNFSSNNAKVDQANYEDLRKEKRFANIMRELMYF